MLAAFLLARYHDTCGNMSDADRGVRLVHVLSAFSRGPIRVDSEVFRADVDLHGVVDHGIDEDRRERCVAPSLLIERRDPNQAVHTLLCLQVAVRVTATYLQSDRLDASLFGGDQIEHRNLEIVRFSPTRIHAHEHLRPILRVGASGTRVYRQQSLPFRVRAAQHVPELELLDRTFEFTDFRPELLLHPGLAVCFDQFSQLKKIAGPALEPLPRLDLPLEFVELLHDRPRLVGILPETRHRCLLLQFGNARPLRGYVKDTP